MVRESEYTANVHMGQMNNNVSNINLSKSKFDLNLFLKKGYLMEFVLSVGLSRNFNFAMTDIHFLIENVNDFSKKLVLVGLFKTNISADETFSENFLRMVDLSNKTLGLIISILDDVFVNYSNELKNLGLNSDFVSNFRDMKKLSSECIELYNRYIQVKLNPSKYRNVSLKDVLKQYKKSYLKLGDLLSTLNLEYAEMMKISDLIKNNSSLSSVGLNLDENKKAA